MLWSKNMFPSLLFRCMPMRKLLFTLTLKPDFHIRSVVRPNGTSAAKWDGADHYISRLRVPFVKFFLLQHKDHPFTILWSKKQEATPVGWLTARSLKTTLFLALTSVMRVGDLPALSVSASCLEFRPNDCRVILTPRHDYVPKVLSTPFRAQANTLLALPNSEDEQGPNTLCKFRQSKQLFLGFGGCSNWLCLTGSFTL